VEEEAEGGSRPRQVVVLPCGQVSPRPVGRILAHVPFQKSDSVRKRPSDVVGAGVLANVLGVGLLAKDLELGLRTLLCNFKQQSLISLLEGVVVTSEHALVFTIGPWFVFVEQTLEEEHLVVHVNGA